MSTQYFGAGTFLANDAVITAFRLVSISSNGGVGLSATAGSPDGVAQIDAASGDYVSVKFLHDGGTQKGTLVAGPVTAGNTLFVGASGQVSTNGTVTVGKSLTTTASSGAIVEFIADNL
jgi:hypothetical protein